jgi:hypothetical protein
MGMPCIPPIGIGIGIPDIPGAAGMALGAE